MLLGSQNRQQKLSRDVARFSEPSAAGHSWFLFGEREFPKVNLASSFSLAAVTGDSLR